MKQVCKVIKWGLFLNKRLLKKMSFLLVLFAVPCLVAGMLAVSREESSVVTVALYGEKQDETYEAILAALTSKDSIVNYERMPSVEAAREAVIQGKADTAWIFPENLSEVMRKAVERNDVGDIVTIIQREDNMQLRLVKVKLYAAIYPKYLYALYERFMEEELGAIELTGEKLRQYFSEVTVRNDLFQMTYVDEGEVAREANYLSAPLRGMLAVWLVLAVLAAVMYYMQDERAGLFDRIPLEKRPGIAVGYQAVVALDGFAVVFLSLLFTGNFVGFQREILCLILYVLGVTGFCNLLRVWCRNMERLGAVLPIVMVAMMVFCPVFFDLKSMRVLQGFFPGYYYLKSLHSQMYRFELLVFAVLVWIIGILSEKLLKKYGK